MALVTLAVGIIVCNLVFHSAITNTLAVASNCVRLPELGVCDLRLNVSNATISEHDHKLREINSTIASVRIIAVQSKCVAAMRRLLCVTTFPKCDGANEMLKRPTQQECLAVKSNCSDLVARTYASTLCPSISSYNHSSCVEVKVNISGYCPNNVVYKVRTDTV